MLGSKDGIELGFDDGEAETVGDIDGIELGSELGIDDGAPETDGDSLGF